MLDGPEQAGVRRDATSSRANQQTAYKNPSAERVVVGRIARRRVHGMRPSQPSRLRSGLVLDQMVQRAQLPFHAAGNGGSRRHDFPGESLLLTPPPLL